MVPGDSSLDMKSYFIYWILKGINKGKSVEAGEITQLQMFLQCNHDDLSQTFGVKEQAQLDSKHLESQHGGG